MIRVIGAPRSSGMSQGVATRRCVDAAARPILARMFHAVTGPERFDRGYPWRSCETAASWPLSVSRTRRFPPTTTSCSRRTTPPSRRPGAGSGVPSAADRDDERCRRRVRHPSRRSTRRGGRGLRRGRGRRRRRRRRRPPPRRSAMVVDAVARAVRDPRSGRRPDLRAQRRARRAHGVGERQEPAGGTRRGRRSGRPDPLLHPRDGRARRLRRADGAVQRGRGDDAT